MLLEFSFANFLSFRDKVTISMVATALRDRKADIGDGHSVLEKILPFL